MLVAPIDCRAATNARGVRRGVLAWRAVLAEPQALRCRHVGDLVKGDERLVDLALRHAREIEVQLARLGRRVPLRPVGDADTDVCRYDFLPCGSVERSGEYRAQLMPCRFASEAKRRSPLDCDVNPGLVCEQLVADMRAAARASRRSRTRSTHRVTPPFSRPPMTTPTRPKIAAVIVLNDPRCRTSATTRARASRCADRTTARPSGG